MSLGTIDLRSFEVLSDHGDFEEDGEEPSFINCRDEQSGVFTASGSLGTDRTEVCTQCKRMHFCEFLCLLLVSKVGCVQPQQCELQLTNMTSPVREIFDLTKIRRKPPRMAALTMKSVGLTRWT